MITPGDKLRFDLRFKTAVHLRCGDVLRKLAQRDATAVALASTAAPTTDMVLDGELPHGLKPGTFATYFAEWSRYVDFANRLGFTSVPGRGVRWQPADNEGASGEVDDHDAADDVDGAS